ncbi:MAG: hypothetical protein KUG54_01400, partial [Gammaproteobacteria bacterium]|nr:hypothetical protein [Gammaproteobacteria bacterium]
MSDYLDRCDNQPGYVRVNRGFPRSYRTDGTISLRGLLLVFMVSVLVMSFTVSAFETPDDLRQWEPWVLESHKTQNCPYLFSDHAQRICSWPSRTKLQVNDQGFSFEQIVSVYAAGWVTLPGNHQFWPILNGNENSPTLSLRNGLPAAYLEPGSHRLTGRVNWQTRPDFLPLPANSGLIELWIDRQQVQYPRFDLLRRNNSNSGRLWLAKKQSADIAEPDGDRVTVRVFRKISDGIPIKVTTRVELDVAGQNREQLFSRLLLDGFTPLAIQSPLPAMINEEGRLRVQLRSGNWVIEVTSQRTDTLTGIKMPEIQGLWPDQEVWVIEPNLAQRQLQVEGVSSIDPQQTRLPAPWQSFNAYRVNPDDQVRLIEKSRGDPRPARNQLSLSRQMWLDFEGSYYTLEDSISGTMNRDWRLEVNPTYQLGRVSANGHAQLITSGGDNQLAGVEIRQRNIDIVAVSRLSAAIPEPSLGWLTDFEKADITLHLPPGWRLFSVSGTDGATSTWVGNWDLWDIFLLLIISLAALRLRGAAVGLLALTTLVLTHAESGSPLFSWLNLLAVMALLPLLPAGRAYRFVDRYRWISVLGLVLMILPFSVDQIRQAIYPQLERPGQQLHQLDRHPSRAAAPVLMSSTSRDSLEMETVMFDEVDSRISTNGPTTKQRGRSLALKDPDIATQTGPGIPQWRWNQARLTWSGPVTFDQSLHILVSPPWLNSILALVRVILLMLLLIALLGVGYRPQKGFTLPRFRNRAGLNGFALIIGCCLIALPADQARADWPSAELLSDLEQRLLAAPECLPSCITISRGELVTDPQRMRLELWVDSHDSVLVPLPMAAKKAWWIDRITVDGQPATAIQRQDNQLRVALTAGHHHITLAGPLADRQDLELDFPLPPHNLELKLQGWKAAGLVDGQLRGRSLGLQRKQKPLAKLNGADSATDKKTMAPTYIPALVRVERKLQLGLDWYVDTTVRRIAPLQGAININIPLIEGESLTSAGFQVEKASVAITLGPRQSSKTWRSSLEKTDTLLLQAGEDAHWVESWSVNSSQIWSVESLPIIDGTPVLPPIKQQHSSSSNQWQPQWRPWPGEQLLLRFVRPVGIDGQTFTIDEVNLKHEPGKRQSRTEMNLNLRASTGVEHPIDLPAGARLEMVKLDGKQLPVDEQQNRLLLAVNPGSHHVEIHWRQQQQRQWQVETPSIKLGAVSNNIDLTLELPRDRWLLFLGGPKIGPALLYWGVLLVILLVGFALGWFSKRKGDSGGQPPLKSRHWMLLGLGMSTGTFPAGLLIVGWFFLLGWRSQLTPQKLSLGRFNLIQVGLGLLSIASIAALLATIPFGLLSQPDMGVVGNGSSRYLLHWYQDMSSSDLPRAWVISLPIWVYRLAMLAWSLWLANALISWAKWGWQAYSYQGLWRK